MRKNYSIRLLLEAQPLQIKKTKAFLHLEGIIASHSLLDLRLSRKIYHDFHQCRISPDTLKEYLLLHKLPLHPFFPRFLLLKREYIHKKADAKKKKKQRIDALLASLSPFIKSYMKIFYEYEKKLSNNKPKVFIKELVPHTLKKATFMTQCTIKEWHEIFTAYNNKLALQYLRADREFISYMISKMVLGFHPGQKLNRAMIIKQYHLLSLNYHPDQGGTNALFVCLTESKMNLIQNLGNH